MGLWDGLKKQLIDVIEWTEPSDDLLAYRFPIADNEIQNGAQLTVRDSQAALLVDEGKTADQFGPGRYRLTTANLPVLTKLKSWPYGFDSPFKSEVYFFSKRQKLGQKWGTPQPITVRDREFGSVQLRMFGVFSYHLADIVTYNDYSAVFGFHHYIVGKSEHAFELGYTFARDLEYRSGAGDFKPEDIFFLRWSNRF